MVRIHWSLLSKEGVKKAGRLAQGYLYTSGAPVQEPDSTEKPKPQPLTQAERDEIEKERMLAMVRRGLKAHPVIFVGNVPPTFAYDELYNFFSSNCGKVRSLEIRCSQGCPVPMESRGPGYTPSIYYATVEFYSHTAVHKALSKPTKFKGVTLQITISRRLLPEVRRYIANMSKNKDSKQTNGAGPRRSIPYREQGTLILPDPSPDVNMVVGVGFPKTIV
ncbi:uncharacterized protein EV420DRAFT_1503611 [Desarmillaria tabescens]|uniref:RRM domain-containing protein n=1 Tax=Armillaria tabescens TaxID=1929756 RepID=A0AA39NMB1_ARMTA|nr:uncharacterized protein EV420DRAFT_1503611 [Desarmillaria tabescens]KAK0468279.1 hypothetical protein EV420DRAFT_1503611 [Desarmillaria tabescens]